jgi:hypothetical protein
MTKGDYEMVSKDTGIVVAAPTEIPRIGAADAMKQ